MKKIKYLAMLSFAAMVAVASVSCGDDEKGDDGSGSGGGGGSDSGGSTEVVDAFAQKQKLESIARQLVSKVDASQFDNIKDMVDVVKESDGDELAEWFEDCAEACLVNIESGTDVDSVYKYLYKASNFFGSFELSGGEWVEKDESVNCLQFKFKDKNGKNCVLKLERSGNETAIHYEDFDCEDYEWDYASGKYFRYKEEYHFSIPENINLTLTQNGATVVATTVQTKLSVASGDFDYMRDAAEVTTTTTINDYKITVEKALFNAGKSASVQSVVWQKDGEELISATASATGNLSDIDDPVVKTVQVEVKVLGGKARVTGNISDGQTLRRYFDLAADNDQNEKTYKDYISRANKLIDLKVYLDNSSTQSASIRLEPFEESAGYGYYYWDYEPVMAFGDGTTYGFEEYFDEKTFDTVINKVQNIIEDFERWFDD